MTTLHPKVKVTWYVGLLLTAATVVAHYAAGLSPGSWAYTVGTGAVTLLGLAGGYVTPAPIPESDAKTIKNVLDTVSSVIHDAQVATNAEVGPGTPVVDSSAAFPPAE